MKCTLYRLYEEKWKNSDTYSRIKSKLLENSVLINKSILEKYFDEQKYNEFYISKYLFINKDLVDVLNFLKIRSIKEESYEIINEYNMALPIKWDDIEKKYFIKKGYESHPVTGISWQGAKFIAELFDGRLPYEDEWVVSAKSGHKEYLFPWGNTEPTRYLANYEENEGQTSEIGIYPPNELGIYDMAGNVEEWCEDASFIENEKSSKYERIVKGGCWYKSADNLLCDSKRTRWTRMSATGIGFRIIWDK